MSSLVTPAQPPPNLSRLEASPVPNGRIMSVVVGSSESVSPSSSVSARHPPRSTNALFAAFQGVSHYEEINRIGK
ncbi:Cell division protein kinase 4, partial [Caligus rogercresseyi]